MATEGQGSELAHCPFHIISLDKASHTAKPNTNRAGKYSCLCKEASRKKNLSSSWVPRPLVPSPHSKMKVYGRFCSSFRSHITEFWIRSSHRILPKFKKRRHRPHYSMEGVLRSFCKKTTWNRRYWYGYLWNMQATGTIKWYFQGTGFPQWSVLWEL